MVKRCTVIIDEVLFRAAKAKAAKEGKTMKQVISDYLREYAREEVEELENLERVKQEWQA